MELRASFRRRQLTDEELQRQLSAFEEKYGMTSEVFLAQYDAGKLGGGREFVRWAGLLRVASKAGMHDRAHA